MENNFYNDEEVKFSDTIKSLKSLPKIKAHDNFEYNLMVKINNRNFDLNTETVKRTYFWKFITAPAVVAAAILAFFLIPEEVIESNNLLQFSPIQVIDSSKNSDLSANSATFITNENTNTEEIKVEEENSAAENKTDNIYRMSIKPNDVAVKEKMKIPFDPTKEIEIDNFIDGKVGNQLSGAPVNLVGGGDKSTGFEQFIVKNKSERDTVLKLNEKKDSLLNNPKNKAIK